MRTLLAILLTSLCVELSGAGEPLPAPTPELQPAPVPYIEILPIGRANRYAVWQNYAVDRHGYFRARVIYTPDGAYFVYDGHPYNDLITHPLNFMPYAGD